MRRYLGLSVLTLACGSLTGCAGYKLTPIAPIEATQWGTDKPEGYVVYQPQPFLMGTLKAVSSTPKSGQGNTTPSGAAGDTSTSNTAPTGAQGGASWGEYEFKLVYLPDQARPYRFTRYEFFAKSELKINFAHGWMFTGAASTARLVLPPSPHC